MKIMKIDSFINNQVLNKIISDRIKFIGRISKLEQMKPDHASIYQVAVETSIVECFVKVVKKLKTQEILSFDIYILVYKILDDVLTKKFSLVRQDTNEIIEQLREQIKQLTNEDKTIR